MLLNTLAHLGGRVFTSTAGLVIATLITARLGAAAMGIFGIYLVIQNLMSVLDGGMSVTINRAAAIGTLKESGAHLRLLRTFEVINFCIGCAIAVGVTIALPWILASWGNAASNVVGSQKTAAYFGIALGLRYMQTLYLQSLFGAHRHVQGNRVTAGFALCRAAAGAAALLLFRADLKIIFIILMISNICELVALLLTCRAEGLWRLRILPAWRMVKENAHFMAPMTGYALIGPALAQLDRVIVGHFVSLEQFGVYALIASYAAGITALAYAPTNVFYPTITQAAHEENTAHTARAIKNTLKFIIGLTFPVCIWAVFYGADLGRIIFASGLVSAMAAPLWAPLFLAACLNALALIPHKIFLAEGRSHDVLHINLIILLIYPAALWAGLKWLGYPLGIAALPAISGITLLLYLFCLCRAEKEYQAHVIYILSRSFFAAAGFLLFFAWAHRFTYTATGKFWPGIIELAWPGTLAVSAYAGMIALQMRNK